MHLRYFQIIKVKLIRDYTSLSFLAKTNLSKIVKKLLKKKKIENV